MHIIMIGSLPPPVGGISVHLKRMRRYLQAQQAACSLYNEANWGCEQERVYPIPNYHRFLFQIPFISGDLFHFHTINKRVRMLLGLYRRLGKKVVLTVHGASLMEQLHASNRLSRWLLLRSVNKIDKIICVNEADTQQLIALGMDPGKLMTLPAYIHPEETAEDVLAIPERVWDFMESGEFIISANGCIRIHQGEDLYGLDLLIECIKVLHERHMNVKLLFVVLDVAKQDKQEQERYAALKGMIEGYQLQQQIMLYEADHTEFYPIVKRSHLFIRPTNTDGYGVSIAEAIHAQVPSIASDVCSRPEGTILFQSRNLQDLQAKVLDVIHHYPDYKAKVTRVKMKDYAAELFDVYVELIRGV